MAKKTKRTRAKASAKSKPRKSKPRRKAAPRAKRAVPDSPTLFGSFLKIFEPSPSRKK